MESQLNNESGNELRPGLNYDAMRNMEARMQTLEGKHSAMSDEVYHLRAAMTANTAALKEYIELSQKLKVGLGILGTIEKMAVWVSKVAIAGGSVWATWKFLVKEAVAHVLK